MDFLKVIKRRHSVRRFDSQKQLTKKQIDNLLEKAILAPSEGNLQPWYFVVVQNQKMKFDLFQAAFGQNPVIEAPVLIITCIDKEKTAWKYGERGIDLYAIQSTALSTYQLWLAAVNEGLAGCWIGAFDEKRVSEILNLPQNLRPVIIFCLGYPKGRLETTLREPIDNVREYRN